MRLLASRAAAGFSASGRGAIPEEDRAYELLVRQLLFVRLWAEEGAGRERESP